MLTACASQAPVPVEDRSAGARAASPTSENRPGFYTVKKGDTLYSIALDNGQSYRDVAAWNNLDNPNLIKIGQSLRVAPEESGNGVVIKPIRSGDVVETRPLSPASPAANQALVSEPRGGKSAYSEAAWAAAQRPVNNAPAPATAAAKTTDTPPAAAIATATEEASDWAWPTSGKISSGFSDSGNKGIDIPAKAGQAVVAANSGTVTLVSNALRGYGNLVVIKHSQTLLSVYAHNSKIIVTEGQSVSKGQKIAEVGNSDSDIAKLHFEIRNMGKPVDPLKFLPSR